MRLFKTPQAITAEINSMRADEFDRRTDRATVSNFFNGAPPLSDAEAENLGITVNVNNLFGYSELAGARDQTMALYNKPTRIFTVELRDAPAMKKFGWEQRATKEVNDIIKQSARLKTPFEGVAGDCVMHGVGSFFFPNATDWAPSHLTNAKLLVPSTAATDPRELTHWAIETELTLRDLFFYRRFQSDGWKQPAIDSLIKPMVQANEKDGARGIGENLDRTNVEELAYLDQTGSAKSVYFKIGVQVFYFFQVDPERIGQPVDVTILARYKPLGAGNKDEPDVILFDQDCYYDNVFECFHPFFMDCIIGGSSKWHRVLGLGTLNYSLNWHIEFLLNRAMQATSEGAMNFWQVTDAASREEIQQVMLKHNGIIPENVNLVPNRVQTDYTGLLNMIQFYRNQGSKNAAPQSPVADPSAGGRKRLEVEVLREQSQTGAAASSRIANWYELEDRFYTTIFGRFTNCFIRPCDRGYSEIKAFQAAMERTGVPLYYLQPHNVIVRASRVVGDGNEASAKNTAAFLTQNREMFPPQSQSKITRMVTAVMTGDYALAEDLVPLTETPDATQIMHAQNDENTCISQGRAPDVTDQDVDSVHVDSHFQALDGIVKMAAQTQGFENQMQLAGFTALGGHIAKHIRKVAIMGEKAMASQWMGKLNQYASVGEKLSNNLKQQQQSQQIDPVKQAELQLQAAELQRKARKDQFSEQKFQTTQQLREHQDAIDTHLAIERNLRDEQAHKQNLAMNDVNTARELLPAPNGNGNG